MICPFCRALHTEIMPIDACIYFFECTACGAMLRPKSGDCCVFCSYGSVPCPPVQLAHAKTGVRPGCCR
ncbi:MAG: GDCCVxC domain-containing (seleno)protein [Steroidobacteraceae bacterium]